jgi:mannonate dehydratase
MPVSGTKDRRSYRRKPGTEISETGKVAPETIDKRRFSMQEAISRREALKMALGAGTGLAAAEVLSSGSVGLAAAIDGQGTGIQAARQAMSRGLPEVKITDVKVILTQVQNDHFVNVKVLTSEPGLYGVGCATHAERPLVVASAIEQYMKPLVIGRNVGDIEDIWQSSNVAPYWRGGVDGNNALSGVDGALWDIMGKRAGMPVYAFLGGKLRNGVRLYTHVGGRDLPELEDRVRKAQADGYQHVYINLGLGVPGGGAGPSRAPGSAPGSAQQSRPPGPPLSGPNGLGFDPTPYVNNTIKMFDYLRSKIGFDMELIHDVHERLPPTQALQLAKAVEPYRPYYMEDLLSPEDGAWYQHIREETSTALAMGELFVNQNEWLPLVANRWIDFIRMHISAAGGLNMARKVAMCCEFFGVRTAWHGPQNVSPVGHAVNMHLDYASYNFGIQEETIFSDQVKELFPGTPEIRGGMMYSSDAPGLGTDIDEKIAAKYPYTTPGANRASRRPDGSPWRP